MDLPCRTVDPDLFFSNRSADIALARSLCAECPIQLECLITGLANNEEYGMWGGMSEEERAVARSRAARSFEDRVA